MLTDDIFSKRLFANEFSSAQRKKWFSSHKFLIKIKISDIKYRHLGSKHTSSFYLFNDQLNYTMAYYFARLETIKGNMNEFLTNLLMAFFTEKLS